MASIMPSAEPSTADTGRKRRADEDCESCKRLRDSLTQLNGLYDLLGRAHTEKVLEAATFEELTVKLHDDLDEVHIAKMRAEAERDAMARKLKASDTGMAAARNAAVAKHREQRTEYLAVFESNRRELEEMRKARYEAVTELAALKAAQASPADATE
jgi:hypothetical protein